MHERIQQTKSSFISDHNTLILCKICYSMVMSREDGEGLNKKSWRLSQTADHITVFCRIFHMARLTFMLLKQI